MCVRLGEHNCVSTRASLTNPVRGCRGCRLAHSHDPVNFKQQNKESSRLQAAAAGAMERVCWSAKDLALLRWEGLEQRWCAAGARALKAWKGYYKAGFISPCRATLTHSCLALKERAPFTWWGRVGGPGRGQHIWSPCSAFPKELLVRPVLPMQCDYKNVNELQVSFLFPQKKTGRHSH